MKKYLCFDMDGTIADFYSVPRWLSKLQREDETPYLQAKPLLDMQALRKELVRLQKKGWEVRIISWLSKDASPEFSDKIRKAKKAWLTRYKFPSSVNHFVKYGRTKADCLRGKSDYAILFDDNEKIRKGWKLGKTIKPEKIMEELKKL